MPPIQPKEFMLYYAALMLICLVIFMRRRPRKGMRLRLRGPSRDSRTTEGRQHGEDQQLGGKQGPEVFSHIQPKGERPLNVVFNYNGHSWDAYEVLGLPAGSSLEKVEEAYRTTLASVDAGSKPFMEAAYQAIMAEWKLYRGA